MESTMNASEVAAWALEEIRTGRARVVVGRRPDKKAAKRRSRIPFAAAALFPILMWTLFPGDATVTLKVRNNRQAAVPNADIVLRSESGTNHECRTDRHGEVEVRIPRGTYRIYKLEGDKKTPSHTSLKCDGNMSFTAQFGGA